jgi:predicted ATPase
LTPEAKDILQVASVIGRHFAYPVLNAIYAKKTNLPDNLKDLNRFDLILSEQPELYIFKHIMTQEVAYESLAFSRRRELHNSIGDHLEQVNEKAIDDVLGILAHHYYFAQNWVPAFYYSVEAGDKAKKAYANQEALAHYDRALEVFDKMVEAGILPELERQIKEAEEAEKAEKAKAEPEKK